MSNHKGWLRTSVVWLPAVAVILILCLSGKSEAADSGFKVQVSPSPLIVTLTPGKTQTATVTVRNLSNHSETLEPHLSGIAVDSQSEKISVDTSINLGLDDWIHFKQSSLTLAPGATQNLDIIYDTPQNVGFSYALAVNVSPRGQPAPAQGADIKPAVAIFNLININRSDAKRELSIEKFVSDTGRYEYLPATFDLTIHNSGNIIDQPVGTIYIQRNFDDDKPIATIPVNKAGSYILPNTSRKLSSVWDSGFPKYITDGDKKTSRWDWRHLDQLRLGKYVAKVVLVYNDGQRDVPLLASYTFWVIPWKILLAALLVGGLVVTGAIAWARAILKGTKRVGRYARHK